MIRYRLKVLALNLEAWKGVRGKIGYITQFTDKTFRYSGNDLQALRFSTREDADMALQKVNNVAVERNLPCKVNIEEF